MLDANCLLRNISQFGRSGVGVGVGQTDTLRRKFGKASEAAYACCVIVSVRAEGNALSSAAAAAAAALIYAIRRAKTHVLF